MNEEGNTSETMVNLIENRPALPNHLSSLLEWEYSPVIDLRAVEPPTSWLGDLEGHSPPKNEQHIEGIKNCVWLFFFQTLESETNNEITRPMDLSDFKDRTRTTGLNASGRFLRERIALGNEVFSKRKQQGHTESNTSGLSEFVWSEPLYRARKAAGKFSSDTLSSGDTKASPSYLACDEDRPVPFDVEYQEPLSLLDPDADHLDE